MERSSNRRLSTLVGRFEVSRLEETEETNTWERSRTTGAAHPRWLMHVAPALLGALVVSQGVVAMEKEWRQLAETTNLSWEEVAQICPTDGITPCSGSVGNKDLSNWTWATADQVVEFMADYEPALASAEPPMLQGPEYFYTAPGFFGIMHSTGYSSGYGRYSEWTIGVTASLSEDGAPIHGRASFGWWPPGGAIGVSAGGDVTSRSWQGGVWLWRPAGLDPTPPIVVSRVDGIPANRGWYVSDVSVTWEIVDLESAAVVDAGCEDASVTQDGASHQFSCEVTSEGGSTNKSIFVMRDATAPTLSCATSRPQFELGQLGAIVTATVADAVSGPSVLAVNAAVSTAAGGSFSTVLSATDLAGNEATIACPYDVLGDDPEPEPQSDPGAEPGPVSAASCAGMTATIVGTSGDDDIVGTNGSDVIAALGGDDEVDGRGGNDTICGGDGDDTVFGGNGSDRIYGNAGDDQLHGGRGPDNLDGGAGTDSIRGDSGPDSCTSGERRMSSCTEY